MRRLTLLVASCIPLLAGCAGDLGREPPSRSATSVPRAPLSPAATSVDGAPIRSTVFGRGPTAVLILGGVHGDEPTGSVLARRLCTYLGQHPEALDGHRVVVVPAANPDGLARGHRGNAHGVDINRNFPTRNRQEKARYGFQPLSEPESCFIAALIREYRPAAIVQIHQPLGCVDWDGPGRDLANTMARACGLHARKLGAQPGSLGSYAGVDQQIPTITLELPGSASRLSPDALWQRYGPALLAALR